MAHIKAICLIATLFLPFLAQAGSGERIARFPEQIRPILAQRLSPPELDSLKIPFQADDHIRALARDISAGAHSDHQKLAALKSYFRKQGFLERYDRDGLRTAIEAASSGEGNCMAFANLFVALARSMGLRAVYLDASTIGDEFAKSGSVLVRYGHVLVGVRMGAEFTAIDFDGRAGSARRFEVLSDLEAIADYYNNLGYELAWTHRDKGGLGSQEVIAAFSTATRVAPGFARAWNNLGVAYGRARSPERAVRSYRRAIAADAAFPAPWANLGQLALRQEDLTLAQQALVRAVELAPSNPHYRYFLAKALTGKGDLTGALAQLKKGIQLDDSLFQIHMHLAEIHWQLDQLDLASAAARRVLELIPGHLGATRLLMRLQGLENEKSRNILPETGSRSLTGLPRYARLP